MSGHAVWINGSWTDRIDPSDRGFALGDGVFDTLTAFNRIPFAGARHLDRLRKQASVIGISLDAKNVREAWDAVLARTESENVILRTTVTRGAAGRGLWPAATPTPTLAISAAPWNSSLFAKEVRLVISAISRNPGSPSSRLKTLGYLDHVLAARDAAERGADDALFLNVAGHVACTTIANVFAIAGGQLLAPPLIDGVMPGIMRALVLEAAPSIGLEPHERSVSPQELLDTDAVFLTNSVRVLSPVVSLDGQELSRRGAKTEATIRTAVAGLVLSECGFDLGSAH
jgi:branched-chain amino acid aminotransferase